jgi:hypothetical protein
MRAGRWERKRRNLLKAKQRSKEKDRKHGCASVWRTAASKADDKVPDGVETDSFMRALPENSEGPSHKWH